MPVRINMCWSVGEYISISMFVCEYIRKVESVSVGIGVCLYVHT